MKRSLFIDNDALLKLARYDLLDEARALFEADVSDVRVLATAKYSLLPKRNELLRCKDEASASRLKAFLEAVTELDSHSVDQQVLDSLITVEGIDAGEAILFAAAVADDVALVMTGDKRAISCLSNDTCARQATQRLAGRIVPIEGLFLRLLQNNFSEVQARVLL